VETRLKETALLLLSIALLLSTVSLFGQDAASTAGPPPSTGGFFPLSEVHRGLTGTAWTVFQGTAPEPMEVEILGVLKGARGPGHDLILAQLHGARPEYTGVVAGMSGSPVYVGKRLLGSLSYRIGEFSKDPIAGITPIEQMLEVRDLPIESASLAATAEASPGKGSASGEAGATTSGMTFQAMETPLLMSGFAPEAIRLWQQKMAGTGLETVAAGGAAGSSAGEKPQSPAQAAKAQAEAIRSMVPGSAVSVQLIRGDLEIAATCTVTYVDPKQLLACGHPILQAGPVSLPMTATEVVATLASPLNAFKIVNTGATIGAFTEDRDAAIRGVFGAQARMIPMHIAVHSGEADRKLSIEVLDLPSITFQAVLVGLYQALLETNDSTAQTSYHITGSIDLEGVPAVPLDVWAPAGDQAPGSLQAAILVADRFSRIYSNGSRQGAVRGIDLHIEAIPTRLQVELETARLVSSDIVHAGDTVVVEATLRPWRQPARNIRIPVKLPARLDARNLRILVSDASTLDRTLDQPRFVNRPARLDAVVTQARRQHAADRIYVSLLVPEAQAGVDGQTLTSLPLSMANALEPMRAAQDLSLNGESAELAAEAAADGVLSGFLVLNVRIEPGGGLN
jgi:hypothetical protein